LCYRPKRARFYLMRTCDGIFSANFASAWLKQQECGEKRVRSQAEA
jgi:hypothetical protein